MRPVETPVKPHILVVKHSLNRYNLPLAVEPVRAEITYYIQYLDPLIEKALQAEGVDYERLGLLKMWKEILQRKYDLVSVSIDHFLEFKGTFALCKLIGVPVAFLSDRWHWKKQENYGGPKTRLLQALSNLFLGEADCYFVTGSKQAEYFESLGAKKGIIHPFYEARCTRMPEAKCRLGAAEVRKQLGTEGKVVFLYTGRILMERKNLDQVIEAFARLKGEGENVALVLIGYGRDRQPMMDASKQRGLGDAHFVDFLEYVDPNMGAYYEAADAFVFVGKSEPMGFSLVEACAFGLPVITSNDVGAAYDYAVDGVNGFVIKSDDAHALYEAMKKLAGSKELRERMSRESKKLIQRIEAKLPSFEEALIQAAEKFTAKRGSRT